MRSGRNSRLKCKLCGTNSIDLEDDNDALNEQGICGGCWDDAAKDAGTTNLRCVTREHMGEQHTLIVSTV